MASLIDDFLSGHDFRDVLPVLCSYDWRVQGGVHSVILALNGEMENWEILSKGDWL